MAKLNFEKDFEEISELNFYKNNYKIGLDLDEVLADFMGGYKEKHGDRIITNWYFSYDTGNNLNFLKNDKQFWLNLKPLINPNDLPFLPTCYISKRNFPESWTMEWLEKNHFPCVPIVHVEHSKIEKCKEWKLDYFVDDSIFNFQQLNSAGINTFLMDGIHNRQYNVGHYRLLKIKDIITKI